MRTRLTMKLARLRRIEARVRTLERMVEDERPCPEIVAELCAAQEALRDVGFEIIRDFLRSVFSGPRKRSRRSMLAACKDLVERI